jgi:hypothetical protein
VLFRIHEARIVVRDAVQCFHVFFVSEEERSRRMLNKCTSLCTPIVKDSLYLCAIGRERIT